MLWMPMSSPQMTRMFGFFAGALACVRLAVILTAAAEASNRRGLNASAQADTP